MLSTNELLSNGEKATFELPRLVAISVQPFNNLDVPLNNLMQNVVIKTLEDGNICLIDNSQTTHYNNNIQQCTIRNDLPTVYLEPEPKKTVKPKGTDLSYKCLKCDQEFNTIPLYRKHMLSHRNMKKFKCTKCSMGYNNEKNLKIHMAMHAEGKPTCPLCNVTFQRLASLKSHLMLHEVEELYSCDECKAEFDKEDDLIKHIEIHVTTKSNENKPLECPYCKVVYEDVTEYKEHISFHIKLKKLVLKGKRTRKSRPPNSGSHICHKCGKSFMKASLLKRHERIHSGEKPYVCQYCKRGFTQKGTLQIHLSKHTGIKPFECTLCPAKFNQKGNLRVHIEKTHTAPNAGEKIYKCTLCNCIFKKVATLNGHVTKVHTENADIAKIMNQLTSLGEQVKTATTEIVEVIPPVIEDAHQNLLLSNNLNSENVQAEEIDDNSSYVRLTESHQDGAIRRYLVLRKKIGDIRWYCCSYCKKQFKKPSDLIRHIRIHTREKPFKCKQCNSQFSLKSTLISHMRRHTRQTELTCEKCDRVFTSQRNLDAHIRKHEKNYLPIYQCSLCNKIFNSPDVANDHRGEHDNDLNCIRLVLKQPISQTTTVTQSGVKVPKKVGEIDGKYRPHRCSVCDASFTKLINLKRHLKIHNDERSYKCDLCPKAFISSYRLSEHLKYHNNIRKFECHICMKKFVTSSLLKRHVLIHNNSRPYLCPYCDKTFKTIVLTRSHIRKVHKKEINSQTIEAGQLIKEPEEKTLVTTEKPQNEVINLESVEPTEILQDVNTQNLILGDQIYQIPSTSMQILSEINTKKDGVLDSQLYPTVYNLQLNDSNYTQNAQESLLINSVNNGIQDQTEPNIFFNINSQLRDLQTDIYNDSGVVNNISIIETDKTTTTPKDFVIDNYSLNSLLTNANNGNIAFYTTNDFPNIVENTNNLSIVNMFENNSTAVINDFSIADTPLESVTSTKTNIDEEIFENTNIICMHCNEVFKTITFFKDHSCKSVAQKSTPEEIIKPDPPPLVMINKTKDDIKKKEKKKPDFECLICKLVLPNRSVYVKHLATHSNSKGALLRTCKFCNKNFKKPSDLKRHLRIHTGETPFACKVCPKKFALKSTLDSHMRTHDPLNNKNFKCDVCNSFFSFKSSLKIHMLIHTGKKPHACSHCPMSFRTAAHKRSHEFTKHVLVKKKPKEQKITSLLESVAAEVVNNLQTEQTELLEKTDEQPPDTAINLLNLTSSDTILTDQIQLDTLALIQQLQSQGIIIQDATTDLLQQAQQQTPFLQLDNVTLSFSLNPDEPPSQLPDVPAVQEKPRNLECDICHKKYASKDVLRKHKKIHGRLKPFPCDKCDKGFNRAEELEQHIKLHSGYRPYSCTFCNNSFGQEQSLKTHIKRIHGHNINLTEIF